MVEIGKEVRRSLMMKPAEFWVREDVYYTYACKNCEQMCIRDSIRVILIKISDRLHNMRTMEYQTPAKQKQQSLETMEIYAPIACLLYTSRCV